MTLIRRACLLGARRLFGVATLVLCIAAGQAAPAEAADGVYGGLLLPYAFGQSRIVVRVTEHGPGRHAVDFGMSYEDVYAMHGGQVAYTGSGTSQYGNYVVIDHLDYTCAIYAHFDAVGVRDGQSVQQGERLGRSGNSGNSTGPHLHAAVFRKINAACGPANALTELPMLFDEGPGRELRAGDWVASRSHRPPAAAQPSAADNVVASPAGIARPGTIASSPNGPPHTQGNLTTQQSGVPETPATAGVAVANGGAAQNGGDGTTIGWDGLFGWLAQLLGTPDGD